MIIREFLEKEIIAAGERVLGKKDSYPQVVFYLCKNYRQGDLCTPWCLRMWDGRLAEQIAEALNKNHETGSVPMANFKASGGYINIRFSDEYLVDAVNDLSRKFHEIVGSEVVIDDRREDFLKNYCIYLAGNEETCYFTGKLTENLRQLAVLIVFADMMDRPEILPEEIYALVRNGIRESAFLKAAACVLCKGDRPSAV